MILNNEKIKCETNMSGSTAFTIQANAKMFKILSSGLYSNKEKAIIREVSCNAYDANVDAGNGNIPIVVHLPNELEPYFSIKDNGPGLTPDQMVNVYTQYGNSTKTDRNDQIGALGLGSKSPFSYIDSFTVISITDKPSWIEQKEVLDDKGELILPCLSMRFDLNNPEHLNSSLYDIISYEGKIKNTYSCYIGENGEPILQSFGIGEDTTETNGVEVTFPVKSEDYSKFRKEAEITFRPFSIHPKIIGNQDYTRKEFEVILSSDENEDADWQLVQEINPNRYNRTSIQVAVQGNIEYPINTGKIEDVLSRNAKNLLRENFRLHFNIGELDIAASREELGYDKTTIGNIAAKFEKMSQEIVNVQNEKLKSFETRYEVMQYVAKIVASSNLYNGFEFTYKNEIIKTFINFDSNIFNIIKYSQNSRGNIKREILKGSYDSEYTLNIGWQNVIWVLNDDNKAGKAVSKARAEVSSATSVYLVQDESFFDLIGNPPYLKTSELQLTKPSGNNKTRTGNFFKKYYHTSSSSFHWGNNYASADYIGLDVTKHFFYIEIRQSKTAYGKNIHPYIEIAKLLGLIEPNQNIYGVSVSHARTKKFKDYNCTEFTEYIINKVKRSRKFKKEVKELGDYNIFLKIKKSNSDWLHLINSKSFCDKLPDGNLLKEVSEYYLGINIDYKLEMRMLSIKEMANRLGIETPGEIYTKHEQLNDLYPLMSYMNWRFDKDNFLDYIKGQDLLRKLSTENPANTSEKNNYNKQGNNIMNTANTTQKIETNPNISMSYEDIAKELGLTVKEVKDTERSAIKKLKHPRIGRDIKRYLGLGASETS